MLGSMVPLKDELLSRLAASATTTFPGTPGPLDPFRSRPGP
jgi:hypothetical protein